MLKKHKKLLVLLAVLAALIILFIFVSTSGNPAISGKLFSIDSSQIGQVELKNQYGEYTFTLQNGKWIVGQDGQEYRTNDEKMKLMMDALGNFTVSRILDQEIDAYGLKDPLADVTVKTSDGKEYSFLVGNTTVSSSSAYIKDAQTGLVGLTPTANVAQLDGSLTAYRDKNIFTIDNANIRQIIYYKNGQPSVGLVSDGTNWYLNYPYEAPARAIVTQEILTMLNGWTIAGFPDPEQVSAGDMGLDNNSDALVLVDAQGKQQALQFGKQSGSATFVRTGGEDEIAMLYTADIDFSALNAEDLVFIAPLKTQVSNVASITVAAENERYVLEANHEAKTASLNGKLINYEDFISIYYAYITLLADGRDDKGATDMTPVAELSTMLSDGSTLSMTLVPRDDSTYYMALSDGTSFYYMEKQRLEELMQRIRAVAS
ncbi:MAG: DUF4340 domain-containing protein [Christensenella sp.]|nr:DUF4340 domain-containing protein [Christensenella sp.]